MLRRIVSCAAMLAAWAIAGNAAQITIADTLLSAAGVAAVGVDHFVVSWPTFTDQDGNTIVAGSKTVHVANGGFSITLESSDTSNPKVPYTVSYYSGGSTVATQTWVINTPNPVTTVLPVSQVNTTQTIAANYLLPLNQISTTGAQNGYVIEMTGSGPAWQPNAGGGGISGLSTSAIVTGASPTTIQTPQSATTIDSSGNISTPGTITANSFRSTATTPGSDIMTAGTGQINGGILDANSAGFAAPVSGGASYLLKMPSTITAGLLTTAAPAVDASDGVNESALSITPLSSLQGALTLTTTGTSGAATLSGNTLNIPQYAGGSPGGSDTQVQYNSSGAFAGSANFNWLNASSILDVKGALRVESSTFDSFMTPHNATSVPTKINIPPLAAAAFGQVLAFGITSSSPDTARVMSVFDDRQTDHQDSIALFDPDENNIFGLRWHTFDAGGNGLEAFLENTNNSATASISLMVGPSRLFSVQQDGIATVNAILGTTATTFASLPACSSNYEGYMRAITDSSVNTWGSTIAGSGTNHVLAYCDGTAWTVMAK